MPYLICASKTANMGKITINTNDFHPQLLQAECPKCAKQVTATILNEYHYYTELYHNIPECGNTWTFSTYQQCKVLQKNKFKELAQKAEKYVEKNRLSGIILVGGPIGFYSFAILASLGVGAIAIPIGISISKAIGNTLLNKEDELKKALNESYEIKDLFPKLPNHYLDPGFIKEATPYLKKLADKRRREEEERRNSLWYSALNKG